MADNTDKCGECGQLLPVESGAETDCECQLCGARLTFGEWKRHRCKPAQPKVGELRKCLVCALDKPWGVYSGPTGETVCVDCRDKARAVESGADVKALLREARVSVDYHLIAIGTGPGYRGRIHSYTALKDLLERIDSALKENADGN